MDLHYRGNTGVAFSIETPDGSLLFDTGQSGDVLLHNAVRMEIELKHYDALVLSHAHYDHTGGLRSNSLASAGLMWHCMPTRTSSVSATR